MVKNTFYLFIAALVISCAIKPKIEEFNVTPIFKATIEKAKEGSTLRINFSKELPFNWDYFLILPPYTDVNKIKSKDLENFSAIKNKILLLSADDRICVLLFIKNKTIIKYSTILRRPVDLSTAENDNNGIIVISKSIDSGRLNITKKNDVFVISN